MQKKLLFRKGLAFAIVVLFVGIGIIPKVSSVPTEKYSQTLGVGNELYSIMKGESQGINITLNGTMGNDGWYVSDVIISFTVDNINVSSIEYKLDNGSWQTYTVPEIIRVLEDGYHSFRLMVIYTDGNIEYTKPVYFKIDQTKPRPALCYTYRRNPWHGWDIIYTVSAIDSMSGMNRVEFYKWNANNTYELREIITGPGPIYTWFHHYPSLWVRGLICHKMITDEYVKFYAVIVTISGNWDGGEGAKVIAYDNAGNWDYKEIEFPSHPLTIEPGTYLFQNVTLPNNYTGNIGRFFIRATFYNR